VSSLLGKGLLAVTDRPVVQRIFGESGPGRKLATRFVAGEALDDAVTVARRLNEAGMTVSLDHLGEHVHDAEPARRARDDYLGCLDRIAAEGLDANISVKLTQLGLGFDDDLAAESLEALAVRAAAAGTTVTVDMEESQHTEATIDLYSTAQRKHGNLGIAVQSYLWRTATDLERLIPLGGHIRLCKGAYKESADVAYQSKKDVDTSFSRLQRVLMQAEGVKPAIATHDTRLIDGSRSLATERSNPFEFQMLYGIRTSLQRQLVGDGFSLRIYLPYGAAWYPYLTRRLAERPANMLFFLRAAAGR
jgi:proline dehydrogenase